MTASLLQTVLVIAAQRAAGDEEAADAEQDQGWQDQREFHRGRAGLIASQALHWRRITALAVSGVGNMPATTVPGNSGE